MGKRNEITYEIFVNITE